MSLCEHFLQAKGKPFICKIYEDINLNPVPKINSNLKIVFDFHTGVGNKWLQGSFCFMAKEIPQSILPPGVVRPMSHQECVYVQNADVLLCLCIKKNM